MSDSTKTPATRKDVQRAVQEVIRELNADLSTYNFVLFPDLLEESYGGWLLPAEVQRPKAMRKSYELHRLVEKVEDRLQDLIGHDRPGHTVTVSVLPAARLHGA